MHQFLCTMCVQCPGRPEGGVGSYLELELEGSCELHYVSAGSQTQVRSLCKRCSQLLRPLLPSQGHCTLTLMGPSLLQGSAVLIYKVRDLSQRIPREPCAAPRFSDFPSQCLRASSPSRSPSCCGGIVPCPSDQLSSCPCLPGLEERASYRERHRP